MINYTLKVLSVCRETPDAVTIKFKQPALKKVKYLPGQYITLIVNINGRKYRRPYSLSSTYGIDATLDVTVKRIPHGIVSNYLNDTLKPDDLIEVLEPIGEFVFSGENINIQHLVLWGAGSGITPLFSIIKAALHQNPEAGVTLIYCNRDIEHTIFYDKLNNLQKQFSKFNVYNFFSRQKVEGKHHFIYNERLNENYIAFILDQIDSSRSIHYICGPESLKKAVKEHLLARNIPVSNIFSEDFDHLVNEDDLQDVHTRDVIINLNGEKHAVEVVRGKSILEAGLDRDLDLPYSCQNGTCKLCKAKLLAGEVKTIASDINISGLEKDERLLCCSYPLNDDLEVSINN